MILIDDRGGSAELRSLFPPGVPVEVCRMEFGDFAFMGEGEEGPTFVGVERKAVRDLLNSMTTGRLSGHQLIGLLDEYQWVYLIVEGVWRYHPKSGILEEGQGFRWRPIEIGSRRFMAQEMVGYLNTLQVRAGVMVQFTHDKRGTAHLVTSLYRWWQKPWASHSSHLARNKSGVEAALVRPSLVRRVASEFPHVGWGKSMAVDQKFGSVLEMVNATEKEWSSIPGIGKTISRDIFNQIRGK